MIRLWLELAIHHPICSRMRRTENHLCDPLQGVACFAVILGMGVMLLKCGLLYPIRRCLNGEDPMKKFMVLYMASGAEFEKMMKNSTPEQQKKGMDAWMKWINTNKTSIVEGGAPLGKTKRVDSKGASNTKNEIGGYSVVQAESHDAATKIFGNDHPHLQMPGTWIEIVEIMPMPGM
jgi:hypothetical protein